MKSKIIALVMTLLIIMNTSSITIYASQITAAEAVTKNLRYSTCANHQNVTAVTS